MSALSRSSLATPNNKAQELASLHKKLGKQTDEQREDVKKGWEPMLSIQTPCPPQNKTNAGKNAHMLSCFGFSSVPGRFGQNKKTSNLNSRFGGPLVANPLAALGSSLWSILQGFVQPISRDQ